MFNTIFMLPKRAWISETNCSSPPIVQQHLCSFPVTSRPPPAPAGRNMVAGKNEILKWFKWFTNLSESQKKTPKINNGPSGRGGEGQLEECANFSLKSPWALEYWRPPPLFLDFHFHLMFVFVVFIRRPARVDVDENSFIRFLFTSTHIFTPFEQHFSRRHRRAEKVDFQICPRPLRAFFIAASTDIIHMHKHTHIDTHAP